MTSRPGNLASQALAGYRPNDRGTQPDLLYPPYASTVKRAPSQPLLPIEATLSEITGPIFGYDRIHANDFDLTKQHAGEPIGERIVVTGRVLDGNARPVANTLVEIWQARGRTTTTRGVPRTSTSRSSGRPSRRASSRRCTSRAIPCSSTTPCT